LPFTVTARGTAFYGKNGIHAPGPTNQLCVGFLDSPVIKQGSSPDHAQIELSGKGVADLVATLINNDSTRVPLQFAGIRNTDWGQLACFENELTRDTDRRYYRGEIVSDDSVDIYGIHWASGKNVRSLRALADTRRRR
jgi:hypothetical protein